MSFRPAPRRLATLVAIAALLATMLPLGSPVAASDGSGAQAAASLAGDPIAPTAPRPPSKAKTERGAGPRVTGTTPHRSRVGGPGRVTEGKLDPTAARPPVVAGNPTSDAGSSDPAGAGAEPAGGVDAAAAPSPTASFLAHLKAAGDSFPPDTQGAVGPNHTVTVSQSTITVRDRAGVLAGESALDAFWSLSLSAGAHAFAPRLLYDAAADRFITTAIATKGTSAPTKLLVAVTQTANPGGTWWTYAFDVLEAGESTDDLAFGPMLGQNGSWLAVAANIFGPGYLEPRVWALTKATLYAGSDCSVVDCGAIFGHTYFTTLWGAANPLDQLSSLAPADVHDASGEIPLVATWCGTCAGGTSSYLVFFRIRGQVGAETLSYDTYRQATNAWAKWANATTGDATNSAPQLGTTDKINLFDARIRKCVVRNGSLWCVHHVFLPSTGTPTRSAIQWFKLTPSATQNTPPTIVEQGRLDDATGATHRAFPSIDVNVNGDALIGWTRFRATDHPSAAYGLRQAGDPAGSIGAEVVFKAGEDSYPASSDTRDSLNRVAWGGVSTTQFDPADGTSLWTLQEYAATRNPNGRWGIWWARVPSTGNPPPVANFTGTPTSGNAPVNVQFTDSSTNTPTSWSWTFGDGGTSVAQSPSHQYNAPGTYTVTLTAANASGSSKKTRTDYITVSQGGGAPNASFTIQQDQEIDPSHVTLTDTSTNSPTSRTWEIVDDEGNAVDTVLPTDNPHVDDLLPGNYTVLLTVANASGSDTAVDTFSVYPANDDYADARAVSGLGTSTTPRNVTRNDNATAEPNEPGAKPGCLGDKPGAAIVKTIWYRLTLSQNALVTLSTADWTGSGQDSTVDTILEIGTGSNVGAWTRSSCNDDYDPNPSDSVHPLQSRLVVGLRAGTYYVRVGGWAGNELLQDGTIALYVSGTYDTKAPTASQSKPSLAVGSMNGIGVPLRLSWSASDGGTGLQRFSIQRRSCSTRTNTCTGTISTPVTGISGSARSFLYRAPLGFMAFRIVAYDKANNVGYSGWQRVKLGAVQNSDLAIKLTAGKWFRNRTASGAWGGSYALSIGSGGSGAAATLRVPKGVRQVSIVGVVASSLGAGNLYVGSKLIKTVSFKPSSSLTAGFARVVTTLKLSTSTAHTIKLTQKGSKPVTLDAIIELR